MVYVEWLRVRGALKLTGIILGILFLLVVVVRVAVIGAEHNALARIAQMQADKGSTVTESTAPDGAHRIVIDDPAEQSHVVVDDYGWGRKHIVILDRGAHRSKMESVVAGSFHVQTLPSNQGTLTVIDTNGDVAFGNFTIGGTLLALILATIFGAAFARENDGHLEIAFTKPVSRLSLGLTTMAIDAAGIVAGLVIGIVFGLLCNLLFEVPHLTFGLSDLLALLLGIAAPLAWYAMLGAATAWMKRGYGTIAGFAWPAALLVFGLTFIQPGENALLIVLHDVAKVLATIDPVSYMHVSVTPVEIDGKAIVQYSVAKELLALLALMLGYGALALIEWQRVEA